MIQNIYIPRIESIFNAEFIADTFHKNGIAKVSKIYIEPYIEHNKYTITEKYNRAYINIKYWYNTKSATNFIDRLMNPNREVRLIYDDENWWPIHINNYPEKITYKNNVLTIFNEISNEPQTFTQKSMNNYKNEMDTNILDDYLHEIDKSRELWFSEQYIYDALCI